MHLQPAPRKNRAFWFVFWRAKKWNPGKFIMPGNSTWQCMSGPSPRLWMNEDPSKWRYFGDTFLSTGWSPPRTDSGIHCSSGSPREEKPPRKSGRNSGPWVYQVWIRTQCCPWCSAAQQTFWKVRSTVTNRWIQVTTWLWPWETCAAPRIRSDGFPENMGIAYEI